MVLRSFCRSLQFLDLIYFNTLWLIYLIPLIFCDQQGVNRHLELGKEFLSKGLLADALTHYHAAIEIEPDNFHTLYLRSTVLLALGRSRAALPDLNRVVELKPDFISARVERGNVLLKQGDLDSAEKDFVFAKNSEGIDMSEMSTKIDIISQTRMYVSEADRYFNLGDFDTAETYYTKSLEVSQWYSRLYERRAICHEKRNDLQKAVADYRSVCRLSPSNTEAYLTLSKLYYRIGDVEESLTQIRECLRLDPDHAKCFEHYKATKKLSKLRENLKKNVEKGDWMECLAKARTILKLESNVQNIRTDVLKHTCTCNLRANHIIEAISDCTQALKNGVPNDLDVLCDRAEAYLLNEQYDEAIEDYRAASNAHQHSSRATEGLNKATKLKRQAGKKDYYKILGVKRNAAKGDITKAYRKLAQKYHPDNFQDEGEKKRNEKIFLDIAAAKEVLTDPEMRAKFDRGQDPLDPEQQQQQQHSGFPHHFFQQGFPFGGEGFSFKFHYDY